MPLNSCVCVRLSLNFSSLCWMSCLPLDSLALLEMPPFRHTSFLLARITFVYKRHGSRIRIKAQSIFKFAYILNLKYAQGAFNVSRSISVNAQRYLTTRGSYVS